MFDIGTFNWIGWITSGAGLLLMIVLIWMAVSKKNLAQVYQNVIYKSLLLSSLYTITIGALLGAGLGSAILPLTSLVAMIFITVAGVYSEKAAPFKGLVSPFNLSSVVVFLIAVSVIGAGIGMGLEPFRAAREAAALAVASGIADAAKSVAANDVMMLLTPLFTALGGVIINFATRDASGTL